MSWSCDVLIIGSGPTGLAAALEGTRYGLSVRIVDKISVRPDKSRALVVHARSLEFFQKVGIAATFVEQGFQTMEAALFVEGKKLADGALGPVGREETPFPFALFLPQDKTETIMERELARKGVSVEYDTTLHSFTQEGEGVTAVLRSPRGEETVRCRYLVGADGAHSTVRHGLDVAFEGAPYPQDFVLCDAHIEGVPALGRLNVFLGNVGVMALFPMDGDKLTRAIITRPRQDKSERDPSVQECAEAIASYTGTRVTLSDVRWISRFRLHHRVAERYRVGRVFLAGDAAHIHSPAGGQGMNTGIQDSWNLMWKVAMVLRHGASPALLETYHLERHRVGRFLLKRTDRFFLIAASNDRRFTFVRNRLLPLILKLGALFPQSAGRFVFRLVSQVGIRYRLSRLSREERRHLPSRAPRAGWRGPDAPLLSKSGETSLFDLTKAPCFHLIVYGERFDDAAVAYWTEVARKERFPITVLLIASKPEGVGYRDHEGHFARRYGLSSDALLLLRPDGHITFAQDGHAPGTLAEYFAKSI